jgi:hypothetical protein
MSPVDVSAAAVSPSPHFHHDDDDVAAVLLGDDDSDASTSDDVVTASTLGAPRPGSTASDGWDDSQSVASSGSGSEPGGMEVLQSVVARLRLSGQ